MAEDYTRARTLASFEHLGTSFRVVRRRLNGKHWRGYLELLCNNVPMANRDYKTGCAVKAAAEWKAATERVFPPGQEAAMLKVIADLTEAYK